MNQKILENLSIMPVGSILLYGGEFVWGVKEDMRSARSLSKLSAGFLTRSRFFCQWSNKFFA
jgi:hypothetical protein